MRRWPAVLIRKFCNRYEIDAPAMRMLIFTKHSISARYLRQNTWPLLKRIYAEFSEDRIPTVAAGVTFFALLALFPAISATVSLFSLFAHNGEINHDLDLVSGFLPGGAVTVLRSELHRLATKRPTTLNIAFTVSFIVALWSASGGYKALVEGLNIAFEVRETRGFWRQTLHALFVTAIGILFAVAVVGLGLAIPRLNSEPQILRIAFATLEWLLGFLACAAVATIIYRVGPDRHVRHSWITWGSITASLFWMLGTQLFTWYVQNFGSYNRVYGDLGAVVGFLTWIWLSLVILLLGAEIDCELADGRLERI